ncbi:centrosomal protein of isoform A [Alligator mississippiensis]|uniref:Centrosomal protein of isoform A n=1 Tax=Alligator mississippiensis TaxID=8496 RepID=A0A151P8B9_ALLMI|nr:centrosomal protein of isoform A [Alligator mississippiensis]
MKPSRSLAAEAQCGPSAAHATVMFHLGRDLEEERQALLEDQKIYRSRARKYFIETNRRRRALEEKWKQKEEKEKRFRERVLQQRKLKHQEATEKFQRTHLPFPQHEKIVKRKPVPQLEEALEQIKGSVLTSGFYLPNREKTNCRTTDSPSVSSRNDYLHQKQTSAWVSSDKAKQENSTTNPDSNQLFFQQNLEEMQQFLEEQHLSNLENFHQEVNQITNSESLSSLDSLEAGEQNEKNGPRLDRTPTDEEINHLCEGVHSALAQKEFAAGDFRHYGTHYNNSFSSNLQPTNSGISLFTIDGGSLMTNLKSVSRMNGFLSSINGAVPTTRRKQNFDNAEIKRRALLEQRRQAIATTIWRSTHPTQNSVHTVQLSPFQYPFEPVQAVSGIPNSDEESTAQFLLSEKLASISVTEGEMLSAVETTQPRRQPLLLNKPQRLSMTALSMEEHKILQSLDHLNQRLQNIQESITKNPSTSRGFQIISPLHGASSPSVDSTLSTQRHQSMSADPRL